LGLRKTGGRPPAFADIGERNRRRPGPVDRTTPPWPLEEDNAMNPIPVLLLALLGPPVDQATGAMPVPGPETADYVRMLSDPDPQVRRDGLQGIRRQTSRFVRSGLRKVPEHLPRTPIPRNLIPLLVSAAKEDPEYSVRSLALFALADTRDPEGQAVLRDCLDDADPRIRVTAACLLTEFGDDSGLDELGRAVARHVGGEPLDLFQAEHVLVALCRITGRDVDSVPMNPLLRSTIINEEDRSRTYAGLLEEWARWFAARGE
jgi:hypothetical protein